MAAAFTAAVAAVIAEGDGAVAAAGAGAAAAAAEGTLGTEGTRYCDADGLHTAIGGGQVVRARTRDDRT